MINTEDYTKRKAIVSRQFEKCMEEELRKRG